MTSPTSEPSLSGEHLEYPSLSLQHRMTAVTFGWLERRVGGGHSGWQGEGAMGGYLFNNSKMQMTVYTEELLY